MLVKSLGDNSTVDRHTPVKVAGLSGVVAIAAGIDHNLAVKSDGTVQAWGLNPNGQLGDNTTVDRHGPVPVIGLDAVSPLAGGYTHSVALKSNGTVSAWWYNGYGQLDGGTIIDPPRRYRGPRAGRCRLYRRGVVPYPGRQNRRQRRHLALQRLRQLGNNTIVDAHGPVTLTGLSASVVAAGADSSPLPDLLVASCAEAAGLTVLHYDADYESIAKLTGQPVQWVVPRGSVA